MTMLRQRRYELRRQAIAVGRLEVYRRDDGFGAGPCMSLYVGRREVLRFDLFMPAHMHRSAEHGSPRHYYPDGLPPEVYVDLAIADLVKAYPRTAKAAAWARGELLELWRTR